MKKKPIIAVWGMLALLGALLLILIARGIIVFDHSAQRRGEGIFWQGLRYVPCSGVYSEGKTIAKTEDGWRINEVVEDDSHTFVVLRSFLDNYLLVREDYHIPTEGTLTKAVWGGKAIKDGQFLTVLSDLLSSAVADFSYRTEGIFQSAEGQQMLSISAAFEGCPVAAQNLGCMGTIDGTWYITTEISGEQHNEDGSSKAYTVWCYTIPSEFIPILEIYWNKYG